MATGDKAAHLWSVAFNAPWCGAHNRQQLICDVVIDQQCHRIAFKTPGHCTTTLPPDLMPEDIHDVRTNAQHTTFYVQKDRFNITIYNWLWKLYAKQPCASVTLK